MTISLPCQHPRLNCACSGSVKGEDRQFQLPYPKLYASTRRRRQSLHQRDENLAHEVLAHYSFWTQKLPHQGATDEIATKPWFV
jgi:hypothetical protein